MELIKPSRRGFLLGLLAAPVIVKAASLMPIKVLQTPEIWAATRIIQFDLNLSEMVLMTLQNYQHELVSNVTQNNALWERLQGRLAS